MTSPVWAIELAYPSSLTGFVGMSTWESHQPDFDPTLQVQPTQGLLLIVKVKTPPECDQDHNKTKNDSKKSLSDSTSSGEDRSDRDVDYIPLQIHTQLSESIYRNV